MISHKSDSEIVVRMRVFSMSWNSVNMLDMIWNLLDMHDISQNSGLTFEWDFQ